jgi:hypothetical protein
MDTHHFAPEDLAGIRRDTEQLCALLLVAIEILEADATKLDVALQNGLLDAIYTMRNLHQSLDVAGQLANLAADRIEAACTAGRTGQVH